VTDSRRVTGVASLALRDLLHGPRRIGRVFAALSQAAYLEFPDAVPQPRVIAVSPPGPLRLPNAIVAQAPQLANGDQVTVGDGQLTASAVEIKITRWWDPSPVFGPLSRARLDHGTAALARYCQGAAVQPGLPSDALTGLADSCLAGDLASAVEAADALTGLGAGLVPSGDGVICGVLLALRLLGGAIPGGTKAVWLADWLGAAATCQAAQRTTTLAAALLHCAANGQAAAEVCAVLLGMAGQEPLEPAATRLLTGTASAGVAGGKNGASAGAAGGTYGAGADLACGLVTGCRAALRLSLPSRTGGDAVSWPP
jgi:Protein of unknown function (DUF2877)